MPEAVCCIYCGVEVDPTVGEGDHIIPSALGEFEGAIPFRRICRECNSTIGRSEQQLLQCGPESFRRRLARAIGGRRNRGTGQVRGAMGASAPLQTVDMGDHPVFVRPYGKIASDVTHFDQLVIREANGDFRYIELNPSMSVSDIRSRIARFDVESGSHIWLHCDDEQWERYEKLVNEIWSASSISERPSIEAGVHRVQGGISFSVTDHYFRAIAKIGFHYLLTYSRRGLWGDEPEFSRIREFIMSGGAAEGVVASPRSFSLPNTRLVNCDWYHLLAAREDGNEAVALVRLFDGRMSGARTYEIKVGAFSNALIVPNAVFSHAFTYAPDENGRSVGDNVVSLQVGRKGEGLG